MLIDIYMSVLYKAQEFRQFKLTRSNTSYYSKVLNGVILIVFFLPESKVLFKEFDDGLGITEVIFFELFNLVEGLYVY